MSLETYDLSPDPCNLSQETQHFSQEIFIICITLDREQTHDNNMIQKNSS
jgi:hypothetical protein